MLEGYFYPSSALLKKACISYQQMRSSGRKERASFLPPVWGALLMVRKSGYPYGFLGGG
mgnify:FL=1